MYLVEDTRTPDFFLSENEVPAGREVDLSEDFIQRYEEAVNVYDGIQAELELIYKSKEMN
jgi:hypothetical protein